MSIENSDEILARLRRILQPEEPYPQIKYSDEFAARVIRDALRRLDRPVTTEELHAELEREMAGEVVWPWRDATAFTNDKCVPPVEMLRCFGKHVCDRHVARFDGTLWETIRP